MKKMPKIIAWFVLVFFAQGLLIGCSKNTLENGKKNENYSETKEENLARLDNSNVFFDLPAGWEIVERAPGYVRARLDQPAIESGSPFVDLELAQHHIFEGDNEVAKWHYEDSLCPSSPPCEIKTDANTELQTIVLDNGTTVYISTEALGHWPYEPSEDSPEARGSSLYFSKDGYTYHFVLYDNVQYYPEVLAALTESIQLEHSQIE